MAGRLQPCQPVFQWLPHIRHPTSHKDTANKPSQVPNCLVMGLLRLPEWDSREVLLQLQAKQSHVAPDPEDPWTSSCPCSA